jgi:hypothetical protein
MGMAFGAVDDEVRADGPEQNRERGKVFAPVTQARSAPEDFKRIETRFQPNFPIHRSAASMLSAAM